MQKVEKRLLADQIAAFASQYKSPISEKFDPNKKIEDIVGISDDEKAAKEICIEVTKKARRIPSRRASGHEAKKLNLFKYQRHVCATKTKTIVHGVIDFVCATFVGNIIKLAFRILII